MATNATSGPGGNVVPITPQSPSTDVQADFGNTLEARDKLATLIRNAETQRKLQLDQFLKTFSAALVRQPGVPDNTTVDDQLKAFTTWDSADLEAGKRIDSLKRIEKGLDERIKRFELHHRDESIHVLKERIEALQLQRKLVQFDERGLDHRIHALEVDLARLQRSRRYNGGDEEEDSTQQRGRKAAKRTTRSAAAKRTTRAKAPKRARARP